MGDWQDEWDGRIDAAWTEFRIRLADAIADLEPGAHLAVDPYVQIAVPADGRVRVEAVCSVSPDALPAICGEAGAVLAAIGWVAPREDEGSSGADGETGAGSTSFRVDAGPRDADRVAWMTVEALRRAYGCVHPAFLALHGVPDGAPSGAADGLDAEPTVTFPADRESLRVDVRRALGVLLDTDDVFVDDDGDIPIRTGESVVYVHVQKRRPIVDVVSMVVTAPQDLGRLAAELEALNRTHPLATFFLRDDVVLMTYRLVARPFVPDHLRYAVETFLDDVDEIATTLAERVGGRRFFDPITVAERAAEPGPEFVALLELLRGRRMAGPAVAELFDHDRKALTGALQAVHAGRWDCEEHDPAGVLDHLRRGLLLVLRDRARTRRESQPPSPARGSSTPSALPDSRPRSA